MAGPDAFADRLVQIESALMQLAHEVEQMHQALLGQQRDIEQMGRSLERCLAALERGDRPLSELEDRDPAAEKPPHY